jgi:PAS domain-containing protein
MVGLTQFMTKIEWQLSMVGKMPPLLTSVSEYRFIRSDGRLHGSWTSHFLRNSENQIVGYVGTVTDITEA